MSTIIKNEIIQKAFRYVLSFIVIIIAMYIGTIVIKMVYNLGVSGGSFIRCFYHIICNS